MNKKNLLHVLYSFVQFYIFIFLLFIIFFLLWLFCFCSYTRELFEVLYFVWRRPPLLVSLLVCCKYILHSHACSRKYYIFHSCQESRLIINPICNKYIYKIPWVSYVLSFSLYWEISYLISLLKLEKLWELRLWLN
jgi:hypothetical protein